MESIKYPFWLVVYHPEYRLKENMKDTDELCFRMSLKLNQIARQNKNHIQEGNEKLFEQIRVDNGYHYDNGIKGYAFLDKN